MNNASTTLFAIFNNGQASSTNLIVSNTATTTNLVVTGSATTSFTGPISVSATSSFNGLRLSGGCLQDSTGACVGRGQGATYVVAASSSIYRNYADYVATGTNDQNVINQAITAAYSASRGAGGKVYLLEGMFMISTSTTIGEGIRMATGTQLIGSGPGTILRVPNATRGNINVVDIRASRAQVTDLAIHGNKTNQTTGTHIGVLISGTLSASSTVDRLHIRSMRSNGIDLASTNRVTVTNNSIEDSSTASGYGIGLTSATYNTFIGNAIDGGSTGVTDGFSLSGTSNNNVFTGNIVTNAAGGWVSSGSDANTITGNTFNGNNYGVYLNPGNSTIVSDNIMSGNAISGVMINSGVMNTISNNRIINNGSSGANSSIDLLTGASGNLISGNFITDDAGTAYAIRISSDSLSNVLTGNLYGGTGATSIQDAATSSTKYTQWDRITLDTTSSGIQSYSLFGAVGSTSVALASTTQLGTGKVLSLNGTSSEFFTVANQGNVGIGTSTPYSKLSVAGQVVAQNFVATSSTASSTFFGLFATNASTTDLTVTDAFFQNGLADCTGTTFVQYTLSSGKFGCGTPVGGGGGGGGAFATNTSNTLTYLSTQWALKIGGTATITNSRLEVSGGVTIFDTATTSNIVSTSTATSSFAGNLSVTGATSTFAGLRLSGGCLQDSTGACVGRGQGATYVVAATSSIYRNYADYVATGTNDQNVINNAITAAYSAARGAGGKVYLLEGTYMIATSTTTFDPAYGIGVRMATGTQLIGSGPGTVLRLIPNINNNALGGFDIISASGTPAVYIGHLSVNGDKANQSLNDYENGINFTAVSSSTIENVIVNNVRGTGIVLYYGSTNNIITGNIANSNGSGIDLVASSTNNIVIGNTASFNTFNGISVLSASNNIITGNTANSNASYGINFAFESHFNTITGNTTNNNDYGIDVNGSSNFNNITGNIANLNTFNGISLGFSEGNTVTGNTVNTNGFYGISLYTVTSHVVTGNRLHNNGGSTALGGIRVTDTSLNNLISSNYITDTDGTGYAIMISSDSVGNTLVGNTYSGTGATSIGDFATGTTRYTQWDRITLDTTSSGIQSYSLFGAVGSTSVAMASTTQAGTGKVFSLNGTSSEFFTVANQGNVGIGTSTPYSKLSVAGQVVAQNFVATSSTASSTFFGLFATNASTTDLTVTDAFFQNGLTDCTGSGNKVVYTLSSGKFGCDTDQTGGGSLNTGSLTIGVLTATTSFTANVATIGSTSVGFIMATNTAATSTFTSALFALNGGSLVGFGTTTPTGFVSIQAKVAGSEIFDIASTTGASLLRVNGVGNVGIGTTSPYAKLSVVGTTTFSGGDLIFNNDIGRITRAIVNAPNYSGTNKNTGGFLFATTTLMNGGQVPLLYMTSATSGIMDFARVGIGATSTYGLVGNPGSDEGGLRDTLTVAGRIYSTWKYLGCDAFGSGIAAAVTAATDLTNTCGTFAYDATTQGRLDPQTDANPPFARITAGTQTGGVSGHSATLRSWVKFVSATTSAAMEATMRLGTSTATVGTSTGIIYLAGFVNTTAGSAFTALPTNGVFFAASSTGNWIAISRDGGVSTNSWTDTGVATTTTNNDFKKFRIEMSSTTSGGGETIFMINGTIVARHYSNVPSDNLAPLIGITTNANFGQNGRFLDISGFRVWVDDPPEGYALAESTKAEILAEEELDYGRAANFALWYKGLEGSTTPRTGSILALRESQIAGLPRVAMAAREYDANIVGVYTDSPTQILGDVQKEKIPVAYSGRSIVEINLQNGPIRVGDPITSSSIPGEGMRATRPGQIVGYAVTAFDPDNAIGVCKDITLENGALASSTPADEEKCAGTVVVSVNPQSWNGGEAFFGSAGENLASVAAAITDLSSDVLTEAVRGAKIVAGRIVAAVAVVQDLFAKAVTILPGGEVVLPAGTNELTGRSYIASGETSVFIPHNRVWATSTKVLITPRVSLTAALAVTDIESGSGFRVSLGGAAPSDIPFDWVIVNSYEVAPGSNAVQGQTQANNGQGSQGATPPPPPPTTPEGGASTGGTGSTTGTDTGTTSGSTGDTGAGTGTTPPADQGATPPAEPPPSEPPPSDTPPTP